jgi:hypothetical protein
MLDVNVTADDSSTSTARLPRAAKQATSAGAAKEANVAEAVKRASAGKRARLRRLPKGKQLELDGVARFPLVRRGRGGKRAGAGRKRAAETRPSVPHRRRHPHAGRHPVLVTVRSGRGLPSLRSELVRAMLREVLRRQRARAYAKIFHVVEFTIQVDHVHLISRRPA